MKRSSFAQDVAAKSNSHPRTVWKFVQLACVQDNRPTNRKKWIVPKSTRLTADSQESSANINGANLLFYHVWLSFLSISSLHHLWDSNLCPRRPGTRSLLLICGIFFILFNGPCVSSGTRQVPIGVDMCQQQLTFAENKTDVLLCPTLLLSVHAQWERGGKRRCLSGRFFLGK